MSTRGFPVRRSSRAVSGPDARVCRVGRCPVVATHGQACDQAVAHVDAQRCDAGELPFVRRAGVDRGEPSVGGLGKHEVGGEVVGVGGRSVDQECVGCGAGVRVGGRRCGGQAGVRCAASSCARGRWCVIGLWADGLGMAAGRGCRPVSPARDARGKTSRPGRLLVRCAIAAGGCRECAAFGPGVQPWRRSGLGGLSSYSRQPKSAGVANTVGCSTGFCSTRSRMMRGAGLLSLLRIRPQIMLVGLPACGRAGDCGAGSGMDFRPLSELWTLSGNGPCSGNEVRQPIRALFWCTGRASIY